ncbi:MAG: cellulose biosynthesis cyclic di-GMP-binding regulatory protein BcsB [Anaerolineae bacterium]|nr:cellulose biosynthesis cyclic di-GMP-binding regulatory protein BcsB [Anaerolineae bacterium]
MRRLPFLLALFAVFGVLALFPAAQPSRLTALQNPPTATPVTPTVTPTPRSLLPAQPTPLPDAVLLAQSINLAAFNVRDIELSTPLSNSRFNFRVPDNWLASGANTLRLDLSYAINVTTAAATPVTTPPAVLRVRLNGVPIAAFTLTVNDTGRRLVEVPLPAEIMGDPTLRDFNIQLTLEGREQCLQGIESRVRIAAATSEIAFQYRLLPPPLDLSLYPRPFYNNTPAVLGETVAFVLPQRPEPLDYEAAASLAAGLGALSRNRVRIYAVRADELTEADRLANQLWIGQIGKHAAIDAAYAARRFPTRLEADGSLFVGRTRIAPDDGIAQIILNPDNPKAAIIAVTAQTPEGLRKATQVLSGPPAIIGLGGPVALVSQIGQTPATDREAVLAERVTFADLGYVNAPIYGAGLQFGEIVFTMPDGVVLTDDAMLDFRFDYSDTLAEANATVTLFMNETPLNSTFLRNPRTGERITQLKARIPPFSVISGARNTLLIQIDSSGLVDARACEVLPSVIVWLLPRPESSFYLPRRADDAPARVPLLSGFPLPFTRLSDLRDVLFVLPDAPNAEETAQMLRLMAFLGSSVASSARFAPRVSLGALPPDVDPSAYHIIALGRPTRNAYIRSLNTILPQPFQAGSDALEQVVDSVVYRLPPAYDIGVLQLIESPKAPQRAILVISGTGNVGVESALRALIERRTVNLPGNVIYASPTQLWTINTRTRETLSLPPTATAEPRPLATVVIGASTATPIPVFTVTPSRTPTPTPTVASW